MSEPPTGLRERRRRQTRQEISDVATRLFLARGFEPVTIADVAAAAGVAKMTVTNHFGRKEDLVLDAYEEIIAGPARTVTDRAAGETPLSALRGWYLAAVRRGDATVGVAGRDFVGLVTGSARLSARLREIHDERERALAAALTAESRRDRVTPHVAAAVLAGTLRVLFDEAHRLILADTTGRRLTAALSRAGTRGFDLLAPSLGDYLPR